VSSTNNFYLIHSFGFSAFYFISTTSSHMCSQTVAVLSDAFAPDHHMAMLPVQDLSNHRVNLFKLSAMLQDRFGKDGFEIHLMHDVISVKAPAWLSPVRRSLSRDRIPELPVDSPQSEIEKCS
jgi:hypothetical protein